MLGSLSSALVKIENNLVQRCEVKKEKSRDVLAALSDNTKHLSL